MVVHNSYYIDSLLFIIVIAVSIGNFYFCGYYLEEYYPYMIEVYYVELNHPGSWSTYDNILLCKL